MQNELPQNINEKFAPISGYGVPVPPPPPAFNPDSRYILEYLKVDYSPLPPTTPTPATTKPEGFFTKIINKKHRKFQKFTNLASGLLSTFRF